MKTLLPTPLLPLQTLAAAALAGLLLTQPVRAQDASYRPVALYPQPAPAPAFRAVIFPSLDPLMLKVVFENPAWVPLTLRLRNADGEVVYQKPLGNVAGYNARVYLSDVADGNYTLEITGKSVDYAKPLLVGTTVARLARVR